MGRVVKHLKNRTKIIIAFILGIIISGGGVYAATVIAASNVGYTDNASLGATNVQDAIDKLNTKATTKIAEAKKECPDGYICSKPSFKDDSWATIAANVKAGKASAYQVGDTKTIDMGSLGTHTVRVANISSCTNGETSETACGFVVEFADIVSTQKMNSTNTNVGGWPASEMRTYVNTTVYNALPSELQNVIATTTVVSSHGKTSGEANFKSSDKLYLLSTKEVWGKDGTSNAISYDTAEVETRQLDYYKNKGVTTSNYSGAIKQYNGTNSYWWLRSAFSTLTNYFFLVYSRGYWHATDASTTYGVAPAFRIA